MDYPDGIPCVEPIAVVFRFPLSVAGSGQAEALVGLHHCFHAGE